MDENLDDFNEREPGCWFNPELMPQKSVESALSVFSEGSLSFGASVPAAKPTMMSQEERDRRMKFTGKSMYTKVKKLEFNLNKGNEERDLTEISEKGITRPLSPI